MIAGLLRVQIGKMGCNMAKHGLKFSTKPMNLSKERKTERESSVRKGGKEVSSIQVV